jgi:hypothetical protein
MNLSSLGRWILGFGFLAALIVTFDAASRRVYAQSGVILFQEQFEDSSFSSRGWYDGTGGTLSTAEKYAGNRSLECRFAAGGTKCAGGTPSRHLFAASDSVYISFYIKHSANFVGSGKPYHPHMFLVMTTEDPAFVGPAYTHLTAYVEENAGTPWLLIQDGRNIDETRVGQDLTNVTEQRAVAGCNGDSDGHGLGDCYPVGSVHWNGKLWSAGARYFDDTPSSPRYKGNWHLVEAFFKLNTIVSGKGVKDGILRYWYDGNLILEHTNVVLRTGARPSMKFNQFQYAPWIGDGSPADQTFWIDDLTVATGRPTPPPTPPGGSSPPPAPPSNLRIIP